jgi:uncharacterized protein
MATPVDAVPIAAAPAASAERIHVLDILRGFALLGMILVHFHQKMELEARGLEDLIGWFTWLGVESKAWGTFAFLFGVGFAVLLRSFEAKGLPVVRFYLRRLLGLALFGFIAEACFGFHILLAYAIWGVPLLFLRRWSARALFITALLTVAINPLFFAVRGWYHARETKTADAAVGAAPQANSREVLRTAEEGDHYPALLRARLQVMRHKYSDWTTYLPGSNFALFLIGVLAVRRGVFHEPRRHTRLIRGWMAFGFVSWALSWLAYFLAPPIPVPGMTPAVHSALGLVRDQWLCFTYIGALLLLTTYRPVWLTRFAGVGTAGRMALTNYLLQIAVLDSLASGYGAALKVRPLVSVACTVLLFGTLVLFSRWWLARYRLGPAEWAWRTFTYMQRQPLRKMAEESSTLSTT